MCSDQPDLAAEDSRRRVLRAIARATLLLWVSFWLFFAVASRLGEGMSQAGLPTLAARGGTVVVLGVIGWLRPRVGGPLLILSGILLGGGLVSFTQHAYLIVRLILGGPPILIGLLLIVAFGEPQSTEQSLGN